MHTMIGMTMTATEQLPELLQRDHHDDHDSDDNSDIALIT